MSKRIESGDLCWIRSIPDGLMGCEHNGKYVTVISVNDECSKQSNRTMWNYEQLLFCEYHLTDYIAIAEAYLEPVKKFPESELKDSHVEKEEPFYA